MKVYTRKGDDGTTGLYGGGRVAKDSAAPEAYGTVDEAQACLGMARSECEPAGELDGLLVGLERDLWVLMAELATDPSNRHKLSPALPLCWTWPALWCVEPSGAVSGRRSRDLRSAPT